MGGESTTSPRRITAVEKQQKALELRKYGYSYEDIAKQLGYKNRTGSYKAVQTALRKMIEEPAQEVRALEVKRLDGMLSALAPQIQNGHHGAIDRALRIMERRARLLGLDQPFKIAPTNPRGDAPYASLSDAEAIAELKKVVLQLNGKFNDHSGTDESGSDKSESKSDPEIPPT